MAHSTIIVKILHDIIMIDSENKASSVISCTYSQISLCLLLIMLVSQCAQAIFWLHDSKHEMRCVFIQNEFSLWEQEGRLGHSIDSQLRKDIGGDSKLTSSIVVSHHIMSASCMHILNSSAIRRAQFQHPRCRALKSRQVKKPRQ